MNAQKQRAQDSGETGGDEREHPGREDDKASASSSTVQTPVHGLNDREDDPPTTPTPDKTVQPIQRPDSDTEPAVEWQPGPEREA